jgi:ppGpp synthetase/RelA/SpoT-type nucleotidyltranferase
LREKYDEPVNEITDLAGIRIIALFEKEIHQISDIIKDLFKIDYKRSEDKSDLLDADKMGYKSIHYIAELNEDKIYATELENFAGLKFEIQIRSILQHAWAEIEHDRNYKFKGKLPKHLQRRFYALAGMLEIADREFNTLSEEVETFRQNKEN